MRREGGHDAEFVRRRRDSPGQRGFTIVGSIRPRRRQWTTLLFVFIVLGCASDRPPRSAVRSPGRGAYAGASAGRARPEPFQESIILVITCRDVLLDLLMESRSGAGPKSTASEILTDCDEMIETLRREADGLFRVTVRQEMEFEGGQFDDHRNLRRLEEGMRQADLDDVRLPAAARYLIGEHQLGRLRGARLEFAVRLIQHHISTSRH